LRRERGRAILGGVAELMVHADDELPASLRCQVLSFIRVVWPEGFLGPNRRRDWITDPRMHPRHFTYVEAGLMRFVSEKGRRWRSAFEGAGLYIGAGVW
jgi:hypothetical protein